MRFLVVNILVILFSIIGFSQNNTSTDSTNGKIKIYFDCDNCEMSFFHRNLTSVDFVRDAKLADIHILVTQRKTASRGVEYGVNFLGINQYSDLQFKLKTISPYDETDILKWERLLKIINVGLLPFLSRTPEIANVQITYNDDNGKNEKSYDPFDYWVFQLELGSELEGEKSQKEYELSNSFKIHRITEKLKFKSEISYDFEKEIYNDGDEIIESKREETEFDADFVYSLNQRWSAGLFSDFTASSYLNLNLYTSIGPAIEYNIFPWDKSDRKVFTIAYIVKTKYFKYDELTIFNKKEEWRTSESLQLSLLLRQPWGEIENKLEGSHYFHDFTKNKISLESDISIRVIKGLFFFMELETELVHDQLYLPAGDATRDEILLRQRKLETNFEIEGKLGIRYTFGSVYNNIINQRL